MFQAKESPYLVPFDGTFHLGDAPQAPPEGSPEEATLEDQLAESVDALDDLQRRLYADDHWSVLLVFQAMDAAGKDSTIRAILRGVNPQGCQVMAFKQPSLRELDHDFLWRVASRTPERGRIGVFNRSHYEEVLVVRVHPEYLKGQRLPRSLSLEELWAERYESINDFERHLARNGTMILKFFLNVSKEEQARRFVRRIDRPDKNWKFSEGDLAERALWDRYMEAYEAALNATSRPWAPWYAIPADDKPYMRATVGRLVVENLSSLGIDFPDIGDDRRAELAILRSSIR